MSVGLLVRKIVVEEIRTLIRAAVLEELRNRECNRESVCDPMPRQMGVYRGDTWAKKCVRLRVWLAIRDLLGNSRFKDGLHVFLASGNCGDASVLRGLGVPDRAMLAVDHDPEAVRLFRSTYPSIPIRFADVADVLKSCRSPDSVYLDFTSQVSNATLQRTVLAIQSIAPGGVVACAFSVGREKEFGPFPQGVSGCESRLDFVLDYVTEKVGYRPAVVARMRYMSESVMGRGTNMCVLVMRPGDRPGPVPPIVRIRSYDLYEDVYKMASHPALASLINCTEAETAYILGRVRNYPPVRKS